MLEKNEQTNVQEKPIVLASLPTSSFGFIRNKILSFIPVELGIQLDEMLNGLYTEKREFRLFIQEIDEGLIIKVGTSNFIAKLMPKYIMAALCKDLHTGDLLDLGEQNEFDLLKAYDPAVDEETQQLYKKRVFRRFMSHIGPHGLKFMQNLQTKDPNGWIAEVIHTTQSSLPAPSIEEFEQKFVDAFKARDSIYGERFSEFFTVKRIIGAGTVGSAAEVEFRTPEGTTEECVIKILHDDIVTAFHKDYECLRNASRVLLATGQISPITAQAFEWYNNKSRAIEMLELDPERETNFLYEKPYDHPGVCMTVEPISRIAEEAKGRIVSMKKAPGIELGKYLKDLNHKLATANNQEEREQCLNEIAVLKTLYSQFALFHFQRMLNNESIHSDLHPGNLFYDKESHLLHVLDLGSMVHPIAPEEHLEIQRFFFALHLTLGCADTHYLRLYYQKQQTVSMEEIEPMLTCLQNTLDAIRMENAEKKVMDVDLAIDRAMTIIKDSILMIGGHIAPSALFITVKANTPVHDTLNTLRSILASSSHEHATPYSEKTLLGLHLKASYQAGLMKKSLWTPELWDYFLHSLLHPKEGFAQLHYEKQFIYGIFGFTEEEAGKADLLIPATIISATLVLLLITFSLKKRNNTLATQASEMFDSARIMQPQFQESKEAGICRLIQNMEQLQNQERYKLLVNRINELQSPYPDPLTAWRISSRIPTATPSTSAAPSTMSCVGRLAPKSYGRLGFFTAGVAVGAAAMETYNRWKQDGQASPSFK